VGLTAAVWLGRGLAARSVRVTVPGPAWPLLVFVWVAALSLIGASSWADGVPEWLKWAEVALLYVAAAQILDRPLSQWVIAALLAAGVLQAAIGAVQFWRQIGPEAFVLLGRFMRASGTFRQPNPYAGYLGYLAPVAVSLALLGLGRGIGERNGRALLAGLACAGAGLAIIAGIGMSWSRGAWIALAAALLAVVGLYLAGLWRDRRGAVAVVGMVLFAVVIAATLGAGGIPPGITSRLADLGEYLGGFDPARTEITDANFSVLERVAHWRVGLAMFADHPWLGVGIGNYAAAYGDYAPPHWYEPLGHAHNIAFHLLAETGFLGAAAFLVFWLALIVYAWRRAWRGGPYLRALALGLVGVWVYLTIHGMFDNLFVQHMQLQLTLLWAALAAAGRNAEQS
jgi:O-antigen ligase